MLGFLIGTLCLIGLIKVLRHGHGFGHGFGWHGGWYGHGHGCGGRCHGGGGPWHHHGGGFDEPPPFEGPFRRGGFGFGPRAFLRDVFERLDTTPGQEKVILQAVDEVREAMHAAKHELRRSRGDVAAAFGREHFDAEVMGGVFSRHDDAIASVRKAFVGAMARVHEALDERQRRILAELIETRFGRGMRWGHGGGPYRGGRW